jgi:Predicted nucleotide kinase
MNISTGEQFPMEAMPGETEVLPVGRFEFSKVNFEKAIHIIHDAIHNEGWLLIDEIGPLELRGEGFAEIVRQVIAHRRFPIVLVAREGLAENIKEFFNLPGAVVINDVNKLN